MKGTAKKLLDKIIENRAKGNPTLVKATVTKLALKGIQVEKYTATTPDDPAVIAKIKEVAKDWGIAV